MGSSWNPLTGSMPSPEPSWMLRFRFTPRSVQASWSPDLPGFSGPALAVELTLRRIPFGREVPIAVSYKGHGVGRGFLDLLVDQQLVVELKAVEALAPIHTAQVISYLKATRLPLGLLITFNVREIRRGIRRVVLTQQFRNDASDGTLNPLGALGGLAVGQENRPSRG